ncbi:DUF1643 domain-containing protein [Listeria booriae]|uniref:DUF1643 domain-containing protein n=1 Tax=Listeria booriae TaxID=1552123 RepID=A0A7X0XQP4_9LIST|nr:DUF1643 domain-containing protein [Listeria booriae]MBC1778937.1 DUF1643 domain-containing protein [Listeria booriae]
MKTEKETLRTEAIFSEDGLHRYSQLREWDKKMPSAMVITIAPSHQSNLQYDLTNVLVMNQLIELGYGSYYAVNLYSKIGLSHHLKELATGWDEAGDALIVEQAGHVDQIILAYGSITTKKEVAEREKLLLEKLQKHHEKIKLLTDDKQKQGYHPLSPKVRKMWRFKNLEI